ncbi:MAG: hypothetical protein PHV79_01115 [Clostridia bacterium]|nr:hypothetical protein [Clostridia bacterium]MDD3862443.1 hypothetical protein [Clostridia bacterium]
MKKILMFFIMISLISGSAIGIAFGLNSYSLNLKVYAAEPVVLTNQNFTTEISSPDNTDFILSEDITLDYWTPINFNGNLNGNGFAIIVDKNLFNNLDGAKITNLGIILSEEYIFDNTGYTQPNSDFGILAKCADSSEIENVFAVGNFQVKAKSSFHVGGLIGWTNGSIIKNSYVKTQFSAIQFSSVANLSIIGGFVGKLSNSTVLNSFAIPSTPLSSSMPLPNILSGTVDDTLINPQTKLYIGGFAGLAECGSAGLISNIFCGGAFSYSYEGFPQGGDDYILKGKIFGEVNDFTSEYLSFCHTFNNQSEIEFIGSTNNGYVYNNFSFKDNAVFGEILNFSPTAEIDDVPLWNFLHNWNTTSVWAKKESAQFIILQPFELFSVTIENSLNDESVECKIFIFENDEFIESSETSFKFGTQLKIEIKIMNDFLHYKQIKSLTKTDSTFDADLVCNEELTEASFVFTLDASFSGSYYGTTNSIDFSLIVRTEDSGKGFVNYGTSNENRTLIQYPINYGGFGYAFNAKPVSDSYAFSKWNWIDEHGEKTVALRGAPENSLNARQSILIAFGKSGSDSELTYLNLEGSPSIPHTIDEETGIITFTIEAEFTTNVCTLKIESPVNKESCTIYVGGILIENIVDFANIYEASVQVGQPVEIKIEMKEDFIFKGWKTGSGRPIADYIKNDETAMSTTINLVLPNDFILFLDFYEEVEQEADLLWLWISLGVVGGGGLIALTIFLIIRSRKNRAFLRHY